MHLPVDGAKLCPATLPTTKRARRNFFMKMVKLYPVTENMSTLPTRRARMKRTQWLLKPLMFAET